MYKLNLDLSQIISELNYRFKLLYLTLSCFDMYVQVVLSKLSTYINKSSRDQRVFNTL